MPFKDKTIALAAGRKSYAKQMRDPDRKAARAAKYATYMRDYYAANPAYRARVHAYRERWRKANRDYYHWRISLVKYGLTLDQYHAKFESQDFTCAICGDDGKLVIDHSHESGKNRGLLCNRCNWGIGLLRESPDLF
jgi:Recombination endonuclease VII